MRNLKKRTIKAAGIVMASVLSATALVSCGSRDSIEGKSGENNDTIVIGSQDYYSNEIIAEIYAQALERAGFTVDLQPRIGQREVYLQDIENGSIDLFPEYTGPLLQAWQPDTTAREDQAVYDELVKVAPDNLEILDQSPATDQDAYVVTAEYAKEHNLTTVEDLTKISTPITYGANSEAETRPNGVPGLEKVYGLKVNFTPIEDSGGPLTVKALKDGDIQLGNIYTADPSIKKNNLVALVDNKHQRLASHVVPIANVDLDDKAAQVINKISVQLTTEDLISLNAESVDQGLPAATIAKNWLEKHPVS